jgi:hypothetical protein
LRFQGGSEGAATASSIADLASSALFQRSIVSLIALAMRRASSVMSGEMSGIMSLTQLEALQELLPFQQWYSEQKLFHQIAYVIPHNSRAGNAPKVATRVICWPIRYMIVLGWIVFLD